MALFIAEPRRVSIRRLLHRFGPLVWAAVAAVVIHPAAATADAIWNLDAAGTWSTAVNWSGAPVPPGSTSTTTSLEIATFGSIITAARTVTVDTGRNIFGIDFSANNVSASSGYTLTGGSILLTNGGFIRSTGGGSSQDAVAPYYRSDRVASPVTIQGDGGTASFTADSTTASRLLNIQGAVSGVSTSGNTTTLTLNGSSARTNAPATAAESGNAVTGIISNGALGGTLALVKSGAGTWTLTATNTFTGGVRIAGGTLGVGAINNGGVAGNLGQATNAPANLVFAGGALWYTGATATPDRGFTLETATEGGFNVAIAATTLTMSGTATGSGALRKIGPGSLTLSNGTNTHSGTTTIESGLLTFANVGSLGTATGRHVTVSKGATVAAGYAIDNAFLSRLAQTSDAFVVALGAASSNNLDFGSSTGASLTNASLGATGTFAYSGTLTPNGTTYRLGNVAPGNASTLTVSSVLSGAERSVVIDAGGGNVALTGANTFGGPVVLRSGFLNLSANVNGSQLRPRFHGQSRQVRDLPGGERQPGYHLER